MSGNNAFAIAYKYHTLGRCIIPSGGGRDGKSALIQWKPYQSTRPTDKQLEEWQRTLNPSVWAMPTGPVSGLFVVDCDTKEAITMMEATGLKPHVRTAKGFHYYVDWPSWTVTNSSRLLPGVDIRGNGGYVNFCGNNGKASYEVLIMPTDDSLYTIEQLPAELQKALKPKPKTLADRILQEALDRAQPGNRNETGFWLACQLRDNGLSQAEAEAILRQYVAQIGDSGPEPYTETEAMASVEQAFTRPARESWQAPTPASITGVFNLTDLGNAERLAKYYGDILHYCYERSKWLIWNNKVWEWDTGAKITALAKLTVRNIYHEAGNEADEKRRKELAEHARHSESEHRINAMINLTESEPGIPVKVAELDINPWPFNCLNGTINLKTGQLLSHRKEDLLTAIAPVEYRPDAQCPRWLSFLDRVTDGNTELQTYLQRAVGYSLTGDTKNQVVFLLYGLGNNGKTTFTMTIRKLTANYGERLDADDLMIKDKKIGGGPKEGIANLRNKRYVVGSELQDGRRLDVSLIKDMTGGETIKARRLYEHDVEFPPTYKLWLYGNHKPVIGDSTLSIWRRLKQIPFNVTIPDTEIDPDLPTKLEAELPGILAWAVKGCLDWQRYGLKEPEVVTTATTNYRHEQDILGDFIEDCCILEPLATIPKADLKGEYERWCKENNNDPVSQRTFKARLTEKGINDSKSGSIRYWRGITLRSLVPNGTQNVPDSNTNGTTTTQKSGNSLMKGKQKNSTENPVQDVPVSQNDNTSDYPGHPCPKCGKDEWAVAPDGRHYYCDSCDYLLPNPGETFMPCRCGCNDKWQTPWGEQLCMRCHPRPEGR